MTIFYFSYGANCNSESMARRCPESKILSKAKILDYQLVFRLHADIELDYGSDVYGLLWEVSEDDLAALDKFEGVPVYYIKHLIWVYPESYDNIPPEHLHDNNAVKAWVYEMVNKNTYDFPSEKYWETCLDGYLNNQLDVYQLDFAIESVIKFNENRI